jgi:lipooligosaccharide transport system ATP-binding protein
MPDTLSLTAYDLWKQYDTRPVVQGVSFALHPGEIVGLLGPNGAGKTTTVGMLFGTVIPTRGFVQLGPWQIPAQAAQARAQMGIVTQDDNLDPDFTVAENLLVFGRYFGQPDAITRSRIEPLLEFAQLGNKRDARIQTLSGGMKRRLTMARALINDPQVLFLDEPTTGLDPQARHLIWERLKRLLAQGKTIVLTTHFMDEADRLCDRLAMIDSGLPIASASPTALISQEIEPHVIEVHGPGRAHWADLAPRFGCGRIETVGETTFAYCEDPSAALAVLQTRSDVRTLHRPANLEDVFLKLTGRDLRD